MATSQQTEQSFVFSIEVGRDNFVRVVQRNGAFVLEVEGEVMVTPDTLRQLADGLQRHAVDMELKNVLRDATDSRTAILARLHEIFDPRVAANKKRKRGPVRDLSDDIVTMLYLKVIEAMERTRSEADVAQVIRWMLREYSYCQMRLWSGYCLNHFRDIILMFAEVADGKFGEITIPDLVKKR